MRMKEVVVVLPYTDNRVLMQLRDYNPGISYPGHWGFFGGSIEEGEKPEQSAARELFEETGYKAETLNKLDTDHLFGSVNIIIHSFSCILKTSVGNLTLTEGFDLGLFSLEEIKSKKLYSRRMKKVFPVISHEYIKITIEKILKTF